MEHKHAAFFRAVAEGTGDEWECLGNFWHRKEFSYAMQYADEIAINPDDWEVRRKQKTRMINGFTVPAPLTEFPTNPVPLWTCSLSSLQFAGEVQSSIYGASSVQRLLDRGLLFLTKEAAAANTKAMLGINPNS